MFGRSFQHRCILVNNLPPLIAVERTRFGCLSEPLDINLSLFSVVNGLGEFSGIPKINSALRQRLAIKWVVVRKNEIGTAHSLEQRGISSPDRMTVQVSKAVVAQAG
jgi:hypothetical protein